VRVYADPAQVGGRDMLVWKSTGTAVYSSKIIPVGSPGVRWNQGWIHPTIRVVTGDFAQVAALFIQGDTSYYDATGATGTPVVGTLQMEGGNYTTVYYPANQNLVGTVIAEGVDLLFQAD